MSRRVIGVVDTMWLRMDRPENLMTIDGVMWTEQPVDWERYVRVLQRRLVGHYPVFSQRPVVPVPVGQPFWEDDPNFDITRHIVRARLPEPGDERELQRYIEEQATRPFDRRHPLW